jgi:hypothetical protein
MHLVGFVEVTKGDVIRDGLTVAVGGAVELVATVDGGPDEVEMAELPVNVVE